MTEESEKQVGSSKPTARTTKRRSTEKIYVFEHDYGDREGLAKFVLHAGREFDRDTLIGFGIAVNNNIYDLRCYIFMNFRRHRERFETWISKNYPKMAAIPNRFISNFLQDMGTRGYNVATFIEGDNEWTKMLLLSYGDRFPFCWPGRGEFNANWSTRNYPGLNHVFLCYSSKDKSIVDNLFDELQQLEVRAWYDKYEIELGDDIVAKINEGLSKSTCGIVVLSSNSIDAAATWPRAEQSSLLMAHLSGISKIVCLNIDLTAAQIPPLLRRLRYQKFDGVRSIRIVAAAVKKIVEQR